MPILAVDQFGKIYATSSDRSDGLGFSSQPTPVGQGDLTLGAAYLKSQDARRDSILQSRRAQKIMDAREAKAKEFYMKRKQAEHDRLKREERMLDNPKIQAAAVRKAIGMGCSCEYETQMSGNALSSNGQYGFRGMGRDQETVYHHINGTGRNLAHKVDQVEAKQHEMNKLMSNHLRLKARR